LKSQAEQQGRAWAFLTVKELRKPKHTVNSASRTKSFRRGLVKGCFNMTFSFS
jgi:hypothetical protein